MDLERLFRRSLEVDDDFILYLRGHKSDLRVTG
jgi:hypothetical protein